ncbi:GPP34 family phosphoprotein [Nonomuraea sp. KM90]|uniref:GPP34 family phosphoprotein n=1 Tax=Nonomuraea sp. KM90 TaxID=3457428 RepID=UPI003FCEE222
MNRLPLHQDLYLIAHDQAGKLLTHQSSLALGLAGAALLDVILAGRLTLSAGRVTGGPAGSPLPDGTDAIADGLAALTARDGDAGRETGAGRGVGAGALLKRAAAGGINDRTREELLASGVLVRVSGRRMGMLPYTRYQLADIASVVRASSGVRSAVEGWKAPDARCAGLCGLVAVLRLEAELYLDRPASRLVGHLREIAATATPPVGELVELVDTLVAEAAVAVYR